MSVMSSLRHSSSFIVSMIFFAVTVLGAYNVLGDNSEVEALAKATPTCAPGCSLERVDRWPWVQQFEFSVKGAKKTAFVRCKRAAVLVGGYGCE